MLVADVRSRRDRCGLQVPAEGQRGQSVGRLPGRAEGRGPRRPAVVTPRLVRAFERAVAAPPEEDVLAEAEDDEVVHRVPVNVERIRADDLLEVSLGARHRGERQRATNWALVPEQGGGLLAPGDVEVLATILVAVEDRHAAADEEHELAVVAMLQACRDRLLDEARGRECLGAAPDAGEHGSPHERHDRDAEAECNQPTPAWGHAPH